MANLLYRRAGILLEECFRTQDKTRRAIGALKRIVIDKGLLNRMQSAGLAKSLDGDNLSAFGQCGEEYAGTGRLAVQENGASAAHADTAAFARAE